MKNKRKIIVEYLKNKIIFGEIVGTLNIIEFKDYIVVNYTNNSTGIKSRYQISNNELLKYSRFLKL